MFAFVLSTLSFLSNYALCHCKFVFLLLMNDLFTKCVVMSLCTCKHPVLVLYNLEPTKVTTTTLFSRPTFCCHVLFFNRTICFVTLQYLSTSAGKYCYFNYFKKMVYYWFNPVWWQFCPNIIQITYLCYWFRCSSQCVCWSRLNASCRCCLHYNQSNSELCP